MSITNETLVNAIGHMHDQILASSAPCNREAVCAVLCILNAAILQGDEQALEQTVVEWAVRTYPAIYADWMKAQVHP